MSSRYSRQQPSPRYLELLAQYRSMHLEGEKSSGLPAAQTFPGKSLAPQAVRIKRLIDATRAANILDYGSGKGTQYLPGALEGREVSGFDSVQDYWGVDFILCYDPGYQPYAGAPAGQFDGVICTDVLEHCPEEDLAWIIAELFGYARLFVFASVAVYPAGKRLPNGENAHATIRDAIWWHAIFAAAAVAHPALPWEVWLDHRDAQPDGTFVRREVVIGSGQPVPADSAG
jgi:hypothetical protein